MRFFRKLRSEMLVRPLPERSRWSRWTFWLRFSIDLMLLLARDNQVRRLTSWEGSQFKFYIAAGGGGRKLLTLIFNIYNCSDDVMNSDNFTFKPSIVTMLLLDRSRTFRWWSLPTWNMRTSWLWVTESCRREVRRRLKWLYISPSQGTGRYECCPAWQGCCYPVEGLSCWGWAPALPWPVSLTGCWRGPACLGLCQGLELLQGPLQTSCKPKQDR